MKTLRDLLSRRDEFLRGVIETHDKAGHAVRRRILWFKISGNEVEFTVDKTLVSDGGNWEVSFGPDARDTVCYNAETKITEGVRPQFDLPSGWVIIYPESDSVSRKM